MRDTTLRFGRRQPYSANELQTKCKPKTCKPMLPYIVFIDASYR